MTKPLIAAALSALALAAFTAPAAAENPFGDKEITVDVKFNFNREAAPEDIYRDFRRTAYAGCNDLYRSSVVGMISPITLRKCREEMVRQAVAKADLPKLTAYYARVTGDDHVEFAEAGK